MKQLFALLLSQTTFHGYTQVVNISDAHFLDALIEEGVYFSGDGRIQVNEAEAVDILKILAGHIDNVVGIESFVNLTYFEYRENNFTDIDLSSNANLQVLNLNGNKLNSINVSRNLQLNEPNVWGRIIYPR